MFEKELGILGSFSDAARLWEEWFNDKEKNRSKSILKALAYHIKNGKHGLGLTRYEMQYNSSLGVDSSGGASELSYKYFNSKSEKISTSQGELFDKFETINLIKVIRKGIWQKDKEVPLYGLTQTGVIYSICFLEDGISHSKEIIENYLEYSNDEEGPDILKKLLDVSEFERKTFFDETMNQMNKVFYPNSENEDKSVDNALYFLMIATMIPIDKLSLGMFYFFFIISTLIKNQKVVKICWEDLIKAFQEWSNISIAEIIQRIEFLERNLKLENYDLCKLSGLGFKEDKSSFFVSRFGHEFNKKMGTKLQELNLDVNDLNRLYLVCFSKSLRWLYELIDKKKITDLNRLLKEQDELEEIKDFHIKNIPFEELN